MRRELAGLGLTLGLTLDNGPLSLDETVETILRQQDRATVLE